MPVEDDIDPLALNTTNNEEQQLQLLLPPQSSSRFVRILPKPPQAAGSTFSSRFLFFYF
jgi:hypothetical protein